MPHRGETEEERQAQRGAFEERRVQRVEALKQELVRDNLLDPHKLDNVSYYQTIEEQNQFLNSISNTQFGKNLLRLQYRFNVEMGIPLILPRFNNLTNISVNEQQFLAMQGLRIGMDRQGNYGIEISGSKRAYDTIEQTNGKAGAYYELGGAGYQEVKQKKPPSVFKTVKDIEQAYEFFPEASAEVQQQLGSMGLSQTVREIFDNWGSGKIIIPSWFVDNTMQWVIDKKISEQEFLACYQNLVNTGIIRYPDEPEPEPTEIWWVTKPSGIIEQMTVTQKFVDKMTAQGWIFSKEPPTITQPENEDISVIFFVGTGGDLKTHFKFSSLIIAKDVQQELAKWISKNYGTTILTTFNNYTDNPITHNLEDIKNLIKQKIQDDEPDKPDPDPEEILPNANMVRQEIGRFQVVNKILKGKVTYIATDSFNEHFYYNFENNSGEILKCYVIATDSSGNVLLSKQNDLRFSETERDETIIINDYVDTEENKITVEFYVTNTPTQDSFEDDFAFVRTITTPYFPKKPDTLFGALYGLIAIPTALTLLGRKT